MGSGTLALLSPPDLQVGDLIVRTPAGDVNVWGHERVLRLAPAARCVVDTAGRPTGGC